MKRELKRLLGCIRRADQDYALIADGDRIAVGISGGKDSLALVYCLQLYKQFSKKTFSLVGITVDTGLRPFDLSGVQAFMDELQVPFVVVPTNIGEVVFDIRQENNPCALCANMRRGALNTAARRFGCNKTALGHHSDDVVDTFLMSLLYEGRLNTFAPKTWLSRSELYVLRPLVYALQQDIIVLARALPLPVVQSPCPACGSTARDRMQEITTLLEQAAPGARQHIRGALENTEGYRLWKKEKQD